MKNNNAISLLAGLGKTERSNLAQLLKTGQPTITISDAAKILAIEPIKAGKLLSYYAKKGWLNRISSGTYISVPLEADDPKTVNEDPFVIASKLFIPCYIGGWSAAEYWGMTEQIFNSIIVIVQKDFKKRRQLIGNVEYLLHSVNSKLFFGLKTVWINNTQVQISDPSRTIVDLLRDPQLGGGIRGVVDLLLYYFNSNKIMPKDLSLKVLIRSLEQINIGAIYKRLGFLLELYCSEQQELISYCRSKLTTGYAKLDPLLKEHNKLVSEWRLWVPENWKQQFKFNKV